MTNIPLYFSNIRVPVEFKEFEEPTTDWSEKICDRDKINIEFKEWLKGMRLEVAKCIFFSGPPGKVYRLHTDNTNKSEDGKIHCPKLNIIFNSQGTIMEWYRAKPGFESGDVNENTLGTRVRYWKKENCDLLLRTTCDTHCLIDGGTIHTAEVSLNNNGIRRCYSLILQDAYTRLWPNWEDLISRFDPYIVR
jgi:hypothetical protein